MAVYWVVTSCSVVVEYQHFRGPCCLCLQGKVKCWYPATTPHSITTQKTLTWMF